MKHRRTLLLVVVVALAALAGCSGGADDDSGRAELHRSDDGAATAAPTVETTSSGASGGANSDSAASSKTANVQNRALIKTGTVRVEVDDFQASKSNLTAAVQGYGGFVSDTSQERHSVDNETYLTGQVVLRVPAADFDALVEDAKAEGEVEVVKTNTEDVTDRLVDLEARLENLRAQRDQLRKLYDEANTTEDVLAVQRELSDVQGEIERLEAQKQSLQDRVAFSTLTVRLEEPRPTPDRVAPDRWYDTPVLSAFFQSVDGVATVARALVVGLAYALPYFLVFVFPFVLLGGLAWRFRHRLLPHS
ncbi:hypothetical protein C499_05483 [Halogeometricum borinquense DSM 11551]|uniref:DUF4349 domain-containing protein n=2 Tax=Halogeometricum borinquense TaxID=60847 RepID=E4NL30_HALBP|nr:DUF4349 domain-containing protein [Halogeometricum borinquense]ADQ67182.1 hypothetical protein Hbor_16120 [Halogeometricum borinquense DSM 11551]ELY29730.1 hypothetical protein C499_05483 [Halogeometricum borinquense DSM 11551]RYJ13860.1 DUF4349 domain-containing protein [Halogeometricum borinquense]